MATFSNFSTKLPDPSTRWGSAGEENATTGAFGPGFESYKLASSERIMGNKHNSNILARRSAAYHTWGIKLSYNSLPESEFIPLFAFLLVQQEALSPFYVELPEFTEPSHAAETVESDYTKGTQAILITSAAPLTSGMICTFGTSPKVYRITRVETETENLTNPETQASSVAAGQERIHITPSLQNDITLGDAVTFNVLFKVMVASDTVSYSIDSKGLYSISVDLEEVMT